MSGWRGSSTAAPTIMGTAAPTMAELVVPLTVGTIAPSTAGIEIACLCKNFMQITYGQNDWLVIGDDQWDWTDGVITQTRSGSADPQEIYFHAGNSDPQRTVIARLHFSEIDNGYDERVGITLLGNGEVGINLVYSTNRGGLIFLEDLSGGSDETFEFQPEVGSYYWFKAHYDKTSGICYGKCWQDGESEPEDWQVTYEPDFDGLNGDGMGDVGNFPYFGVVGNSYGDDNMAVFDNYSVVLASEVPAFKPLFRPRNHLIGGGF